MPPLRLQRWLNAMIVTAVLDRVRDEDGEPIFLLKGGLAMELRLQLARATGDYDAAFRARAEEAIDRLDEALAAPWTTRSLNSSTPAQRSSTRARERPTAMKEIVQPEMERLADTVNRSGGGMIKMRMSVPDSPEPPSLSESDDMRRVDFECHPIFGGSGEGRERVRPRSPLRTRLPMDT